MFTISCKVSSPGRLETRFATTVKQRIVVGGKKDSNPFAASTDNIREGQRNFSNYCLVCHGLDGQNTGVPFADRMYPPVPELTSPDVQRFTDGQLKWIIENGIGPSGMPASRGILNDDEIWKIVLYVRHLPPKGSLGDPSVYGGTSPAQQRTATESAGQ
jgi:cytochrome c